MEFTGAGPTGAITKLTYRLELSAGTVTESQQKIQLFNYTTNQWELVDTRVAPGPDTKTDVEITSNPSRFVNQSTGQMRARVSMTEPGPARPRTWAMFIDQAVWIINR
jgi:uncharacterized protein involved in type VI secretion and phage assembly